MCIYLNLMILIKIIRGFISAVCIDMCIVIFFEYYNVLQINVLACNIHSYYRTIKIKELPHI